MLELTAKLHTFNVILRLHVLHGAGIFTTILLSMVRAHAKYQICLAFAQEGHVLYEL